VPRRVDPVDDVIGYLVPAAARRRYRTHHEIRTPAGKRRARLTGEIALGRLRTPDRSGVLQPCGGVPLPSEGEVSTLAPRLGTSLGRSLMFDIYVVESDALMVGRPKGILNASMIERIFDFIEIKEQELETGFNRCCDLTRLDGIQLSSTEVRQLAARRRSFNPNDIRVKSAILATDPLGFAIARMYEQLLNSPRIEVRVFAELEAAAAWLAVKPEMLTL
jgi:hypothetical protein